jgi:hypothetical protein
MHGNLRYVKSTWIGLLALLALASPAQAEVVTQKADRGVLAVAADGSPWVAYTVGRGLYASLRGSQGRWTAIRLGRLPTNSGITLAGIQIGERPHRHVNVLVEDGQGRWIVLARGSRLTTIARAARGSSFGPAGLTLDAGGRPAIAYAVQRKTGQTFLRLVTFRANGSRQTRPITLKGFPKSDLPPGAAPVLVGGRLHVVETYTSAAIDWGPNGHGGWEGQYLFFSRLGSPQGRVGAVSLPSTLWSAWTQVYPQAEPGDIVVLLNSSATTQATSTLTHGIFVSIARGDEEQPEIGAYDWVALDEDWFEYAGLVLQGTGSEAWQLDGRLEGFTIGTLGTRQLLLSREGALEWFRSAGSLPPVRIGMGKIDETGHVDGSVPGVTSGTVELYRELPHAPRQLVATLPIGADGSFKADGLDPTALYRAVYVDPGTGIPFGFLPGVPVGSGAG